MLGLLIGIGLVFVGQYEQYKHHRILSELRTTSPKRGTVRQRRRRQKKIVDSSKKRRRGDDDDDSFDARRLGEGSYDKNSTKKERYKDYDKKDDVDVDDKDDGHYSIPEGRWFRYVSCPHYLAEIIIYAGFAIVLLSTSSSSSSSSLLVKGLLVRSEERRVGP